MIPGGVDKETKTESLEEFISRGGKVKKLTISENLQKRIRKKIKGNSRFSHWEKVR